MKTKIPETYLLPDIQKLGDGTYYLMNCSSFSVAYGKLLREGEIINYEPYEILIDSSVMIKCMHQVVATRARILMAHGIKI